MKMNLSVVMQTIDKMSAPLKKITSTQSKYSKQIAEIKTQSENLASSQALISQYRKTGVEAGKAKAKFNAAQEKMAKLNEKMKAAKAPSAALQLQFKKQQATVKELKATQGEYIKTLTKSQNKMKAAGINVKKLSSEEKRLTKEFDSQMAAVDKLTKKESRLQGVRERLGKFKLPSIGGAAIAKGGALLGGFSLAGLMSQVDSAAGEMDALSKSAQTIKMPVEELQAMQSQAEHAGVSAGSMTGAMVRFTKRLGTLQTTGAGALGSFLKKGKNSAFKDLNNAKNTQDAYEKVLGAFSKLKTNQEQMAFADAAFGSDGRKMLLMLREGTNGLTSARKEYNDLGGGVTSEDAAKAESYNDAMQKIQESIKGMKFAALAPIMEKMTIIFTEFSEKFKNAKWRAEVIEKVKNVVSALFAAFKLLGTGVMFLSQHIPEVIAGLALFKIAMFALNAAMIANPVGLIAAGVAALVVGIGYGISALGGWDVVWGAITGSMKTAWQAIKDIGAVIGAVLMPMINGISIAFDRISSGVGAAISQIKSNLLTVPRAILKTLSLIPKSMLPDGWGDSIETARKQLESMNDGLKSDVKNKVEYALNGPDDPSYSDKSQSGGLSPIKQGPGNGMLRSPATQSKSLVEVRIKSDKPLEIAKVDTDKYTDMNIDTGDLMGLSF